MLFALFFVQTAWAQPANDDCSTAEQLTLIEPSACPATVPTVLSVNGTTNGATPISPYPNFSGCTGGSTSTANEVWYHFDAVSDLLDITINGMSNPTIVVYLGSDCDHLFPIDCAVGSGGTVSVSISNLSVLESITVMVSGGDINDNGDFTMDLTSSFSCNACLFQNELTVTPPPVNGTYSSGQEVTFCYTVNAWDANATGTIEWLHSLVLDWGAGWAGPPHGLQIPPSCGGDGSWGWYDSWVSCNTGAVFGPGFAYDSSSGLGCGGTPNDGDPGNNWGDGSGNCANVGIDSPPKEFCWKLTVPDCPPGVTGADLHVNATVYSDGDAGSWTQIGCNSGTPYNFIATAICCDDGDPIIVELHDESCPGANDGWITVTGVGNPGTVWTYTIFDQGGSMIPGQSPISSDMPVTFSGLADGNNYSILVQNPATNCNRNVTFDILETPPPVATATSDSPCFGDAFQLTGSVSPADAGATYQWTGPNGYSSNVQNPNDATEPGTYTLIVTSNGCSSEPTTTNAAFDLITVLLDPYDDAVCAGDDVVLSATGGVSYTWVDSDSGLNLGSGNSITVTINHSPTNIQVTGLNNNNCPDTDMATITINPQPEVGVDIPFNLCENELFYVEPYGADIYQWEDAPDETGGREFTLPVGSYHYVVYGTDAATQCRDTFEFDIDIFPASQVTISPVDPDLCLGQSLTLTASGSQTYSWVGGPNTADYTVSPTTTTTYTVNASDGAGCPSTASVTVFVIDPIATPQVTCGTATPNSVVFTWPAIAQATNYNVSVSSGQSGALDTSGDPVTYTVTGLMPGEDVTINVTTIGGGMCGDMSSGAVTCSALDCVPITVEAMTPTSHVCLDGNNTTIDLSVSISNGGAAGTTVWSGPGITDTAAGIFDPTVAGAGNHTITATYTEGVCTYTGTVMIEVVNTPTAQFTIDDNAICQTESAIITYTGSAAPNAVYTWDFDGGTTSDSGQGPYTVSWATAGTKTISLTVLENGCSASFSSTITLDVPLDNPVVNCGVATTTSVTFNWLDVSGASSYSVNVLSGQTGNMDGNTYTVENLQPGETVMAEVTAVSANNCMNTTTSVTCTALDCPSYGLTLSSSDNNICLEDDTGLIDLSVSVSGGDGSGTFEWTGDGVVDAQNGSFDPVVAGAGDHIITLTYTEGPCMQSNTITITVFDKPIADFTLMPSNVCIDDVATAIYTGGNDINNATFNWTFGGGSATPGTGGGPQDISWSASGEQTVTLVVAENGCVSNPVSHSVTVEAPLNAPVINCSSSVDEIVFSWDAIEGATGYQVNVLTGQTGTQGALSYTVSNLSLLEIVEIEVVALGDGACGDSEPATLECVAEDCPEVTITMPELADICLDENVSIVSLNATATGGAGDGNFVWSGDGVDAINATFDPTLAGPGTHVINLQYSEGNCNYNAQTSVDVFALPEAAFSMPDSICVGGTASIVFTGNAGSNAAYSWDFDGGVIISGSNEGPYELSWNTSGTKTVTLIVMDNGCSSMAFTGDILVEDPIAAPVITCETTENSITFHWDDVPGAYDYNVIGPAGDLSGNYYAVTGLAPGTSVSITIEALTNNSCGTVSATQECFASDCPEMTVDLIGPSALCQGEMANVILNFSDVNTGPFQVDYLVNGVAQSITLSSGEPIILEDVTEDIDLSIVSFSDITNPLCSYPSTANWQITVNQELIAGTTLESLEFCQGEGEAVQLMDLLQGADDGGIWMQAGGQSATGFDSATGTFDVGNNPAGTYNFIYHIDNAEPCADTEAMVSVVVNPLPNVDAGEDQSLFCNMGLTSLGGSLTDEGTYFWTVDNPDIVIDNPTSLMIDVDAGGTYTLEVTNEFGCKADDSVVVTVENDVPVADISISDVSCFGDDNGAIILTNVHGGTPPYKFSLNDGELTTNSVFTGLMPGVYTVVIYDANGCFSPELEFNVSQPEELVVSLLPDIPEVDSEPYTIESGDSVRLEITIPASTVVDTIIWEPKKEVSVEGSGLVNVVSPDETTVFTVTVIDVNGCSGTDNVTIFVRKNRNVFIPSAFSPNDDGVNDILYIQSGTNVVKINRFTIFNRWGESVFAREDFEPNDRDFGWDGKYRGEPMNAAVFVYEVEVEFQDGKIEVFSGDVVLLR